MISTLQKTAINAFLIFHLLAISCWCIPAPGALIAAAQRLVQPYLLWSGLFQSWDMFSPTPKAVNSYVDAIVLYQDGTTKPWSFPRMENIGFAQRYLKERYRKYVEYLSDERYSLLWPDSARVIASLNVSKQSPLRMILLVSHWAPIKPEPDSLSHPAPYDAHVFFAYTPTAADLK